MKTHWTIVHGWAGTSTDWAAWRNWNGKCHIYDRGYFGPEAKPNWSKQLIVHSMGLHWVPKMLFAQLDVLVLISSFLHWPKPAAARRLRRALQRDPQAALGAFYRDSGFVDPERVATNPSQLDTDLAALEQLRFDPKHLEAIPRVIVVHGSEDQVVPLEQTKHIPATERLLVQGAAHALPFTHTELCQWELTRILNR